MKAIFIIKPTFITLEVIKDFYATFIDNQDGYIRIKRDVIPRHLAEAHYAEHKGKPFFDELIEYMTSGDSLIILAPITSIEEARADTMKFRAKYTKGGCRNVLHCSDSEEACIREAELFFPKL